MNAQRRALRGLLCFSCNAALGKMADEPLRLRRAADYLETGGFVPAGVADLETRARERARASILGG